MATATLADFPVTGTFQDVVATLTDAASVDAVYQNVGPYPVQVVFGASTTGKTGVILAPFDSVQGNAANVWARTYESNTPSTLSVSTL